MDVEVGLERVVERERVVVVVVSVDEGGMPLVAVGESLVLVGRSSVMVDTVDEGVGGMSVTVGEYSTMVLRVGSEGVVEDMEDDKEGVSPIGQQL